MAGLLQGRNDSGHHEADWICLYRCIAIRRPEAFRQESPTALPYMFAGTNLRDGRLHALSVGRYRPYARAQEHDYAGKGQHPDERAADVRRVGTSFPRFDLQRLCFVDHVLVARSLAVVGMHARCRDVGHDPLPDGLDRFRMDGESAPSSFWLPDQAYRGSGRGRSHGRGAV